MKTSAPEHSSPPWLPPTWPHRHAPGPPATARRVRRQAPQAQPWGGTALDEPAPSATTAAISPAQGYASTRDEIGAGSNIAVRIRELASKGGSLKGLPALLGVTPALFKQWLEDDPKLRRAFDEGKELEREALHRTLYEAAIFRRDLGAAQFLLKTRLGYREQEPEDNRNSVRIVFNIPAAAPDLRTYIEQAARAAPTDAARVPAVLDHE